MLELEYHGEFTTVRIAVEFCDLCSRAPGLAHRDQITFLECLPAQFPQEFMEPGPVVRDHPVRFLGDLVDHIQPESAHAFIHPPEDHVVDLPAHLRVLPVEIRLLHRELVEIVLIYFRHPLPGRSAEGSFHFVRVLALRAVPPHIIIMVRIVSGFLCLPKPPVFIRSMVEHQVHNDPDIALLRFPDQFFHIR